MALPDNRIRIPTTRINFETEVGVTGQDHDTFPAAGQQLRYDAFRMYLIGLLANQSSESEPAEFRLGSLWFDLTKLLIKIRSTNSSGTDWLSLASAIQVDTDSGGNPVTLADWYASASGVISGFKSEVVFSGQSSGNGINVVSIPESLRSSISSTARCFFYINGLMLDPRKSSLFGTPADTIRLSGTSLSNGDTYTAIIRSVPDATFYSPSVNVP